MKIPKLPKGEKPIAQYRTNEYLNVVVLTRNDIIFYLWDEVSKYYNHILRYRLSSPTKQ